MQCERARDLLSPYLDGELSAEERRAVAAHVEACPSCAALLADLRRLGQALRDGARAPAPALLAARVRAGLAQAADAEALPSLLERKPLRARRLWDSPLVKAMRYAAIVLVACALSALATWHVVSSTQQGERIERDVLTAHVRFLVQDRPVQVASSDVHTVKPWFAGRVEFAPDVKDLAAQGFPLVGGRLDYVAGRRVGAVVYRRRRHTIDVFMWPDAAGDAPPQITTRDGYNLITWRRNGLTYWAVSDLNRGELRELQGLL